MRQPAKQKRAVVKKVPHAYTLTLQINGQEFTSKGETLPEALLALPRIVPKTRAVFFINRNGVSSRPMDYPIQRFKRLFFPGTLGNVQRVLFTKRSEFYMNHA